MRVAPLAARKSQRGAGSYRENHNIEREQYQNGWFFSSLLILTNSSLIRTKAFEPQITQRTQMKAD